MFVQLTRAAFDLDKWFGSHASHVTSILSFPLQYYDDTYPTVKEQKAFEKNIFNKTHRTDSRFCWGG